MRFIVSVGAERQLETDEVIEALAQWARIVATGLDVDGHVVDGFARVTLTSEGV